MRARVCLVQIWRKYFDISKIGPSVSRTFSIDLGFSSHICEILLLFIFNQRENMLVKTTWMRDKTKRGESIGTNIPKAERGKCNKFETNIHAHNPMNDGKPDDPCAAAKLIEWNTGGSHTQATRLWGLHSGFNFAHLLGFVYSTYLHRSEWNAQSATYDSIKHRNNSNSHQIDWNWVAFSLLCSRQCTWKANKKMKRRKKQKKQMYSECLL